VWDILCFDRLRRTGGGIGVIEMRAKGGGRSILVHLEIAFIVCM
jgi:hypothetical protein